MIIEYHRPATLEDALALLARKTPHTLPLGGGSRLNRSSGEDVAVVDLQAMGFGEIFSVGANLEIGATVKLETILAHPLIPESLKRALINAGGLNFRNQATIAGEIVSCDGRSAFVTGLLAMNTQLLWLPSKQRVSLGDYLALRSTWERGGIIRSIEVPLNGKLDLEMVARTPLDLPVLCVAVCRWPSGRTRVALGGYGLAPILAMDGPEGIGADQAVRSAYLNAGDGWASAEYRGETAASLVSKMLSMDTKE